MKVATKLYFDTVITDSHGDTKDLNKALHNIKTIDSEKYNEFTDMVYSAKGGQATLFLPTGRFISVVTCDIDTRVIFMATFDLKNNEIGAKSYFKNDPNEETLMGVFYLVSKTYNEKYYEFELLAGDLP